MFEFTCLDANGNSINYFTQYDLNQKINIVLSGNTLNSAPEVHFCNIKSNMALVKVSTISTTVTKNDTITVDVPDELLAQPYPLLVYVYNNSQKTILQTEIPIRKRVRPSDYEYVPEEDYMTVRQMILDTIEGFDLKSTHNATDNSVTLYLGGV